MSGNDYVKFITEEFVSYFNKPREKRKKVKSVSMAYTNRWFGVLPLAIKTYVKKTNN
ncbi:YqzE family protein [Virgibacillus soli]|uniref:YqzE family protein n=1 Tax=Paracerasibacillus soli TaxID=480284 RepID=A0ABU5CPX7_9BACI|nr:YqzE family protein [Virgibacillus soli]MDY0408427.1 YqzE family protein [Virgibacillus soli]